MTDTPPRKLHVDDRHPDASRIAVYLDGERQHHVLGYDMDAGVVQVIALDERGHGIVDGDKLVTLDIPGDVRVEWME